MENNSWDTLLPVELRAVAELSACDSTVFLRARREPSGAEAVVQALRSTEPTPLALERLRHDFSVARELAGEHVLAPVALLERGRAIVYEPFGGVSLRALLHQGPPDLPALLRLTLRLVEALAAIHARDFIHRDLEPGKVLVSPGTWAVKLVGFGAASSQPRGAPSAEAAERMGAHLAYTAPEQTGRTNRAPDYRSDFYSLGVMLYELLTGRLPFESTDPLQLVHAHIARRPTPPHELAPAVPEPLSGIVCKLLSKPAEERYQSHHGLRADLQECLTALERDGHIPPFALGSRDVSPRFELPARLYGREGEVAPLLAAFERVAGGQSAVVGVSGPPGVGKSALVREFHQQVVARGSYFISGKFDQLRRGVPYSGLLDALRHLVRQVLSEREASIRFWQEQLQAALGDNGRVLTDVVPEVKAILGEPPPAQELPANEAQNRFQRVLGSFLATFSRPGRPLVFFVDDLQWADAASLDFLRELATGNAAAAVHLLLVVAFRDSEDSAEHALPGVLDALKAEGVHLTHLALAPLDEATIARLVADTLHVPPASCAALTRLVHEKTAGNPFFVTEFLKALHQEGAVRFEVNAGCWRWDLAAIRAVSAMDNVVDLICRRIGSLPEPVQDVLKQAACIDNTFDLQTLAVACDRPAETLQPPLLEAVQAGLLLPASDGPRLPGEDPRPGGAAVLGYRFLHDRVQQAAYSLIPVDARASTHLRIGRLLLGKASGEHLGERLFDVVNHLNRGRALIGAPPEQRVLARLNLLAGSQAKASVAFDAALRYFDVGIELLGPERWAHPELAAPLLSQRAECASLTTRFEEAERGFREVYEHVESPLERARICELEVMMFTTREDNEQVVARALEGLRLLGFECPRHVSKARVLAELLKVKWLLRGRKLSELRELPLAQSPEAILAARLLTETSRATYYVDQSLMALMFMRAMQLLLLHGRSSGTIFGCLLYGLVVGPGMGDFATAHELGRVAIRMAEEVGDRLLLGRLRFCFASSLNPWRAPLRGNLEYLAAAHRDCLESGDQNFVANLLDQVLTVKLMVGEPLEPLTHEAGEYAEYSRRLKFESPWRYCLLYRAFLQRLTDPAGLRVDLEEDEAGRVPLSSLRGEADALHPVVKLVLCTLAGNLPEALATIEAAQPVLSNVMGQPLFALYHFHAGLTRAALLREARGAGRRQHRAAVEQHLRLLRTWARHCPENYQHMQELLEAELARAVATPDAAAALYDKALRSARETGISHVEALAQEFAGRFHLEAGHPRLAAHHLHCAREGYARWGARAKVRALEEAHPSVFPAVAPQALPSGSSAPAADSLDLAAVIRAAQALSGEIQLAGLLRRLLTLMVENAGAERAFLILKKGGALTVEASLDGDRVTAGAPVPLEASDALSAAVVYYVARTGERVLLHDALAEGAFTGDDYILRRRPRSVLALPLLKQGTLNGILYLENNVAPGAFTPARVDLLLMLSSQAAISIENARLYANLEEYSHTLEQKVAARTGELEARNTELATTIAQLRETQEQLVAQEKLAALGSLTAGIAHELKNPLNFINNFAEVSVSLVQEVEEELRARQALANAPAGELEAALDDLRQNIGRIGTHGKRANSIINGMLLHARSTGSARVEVALNTVVEESIKLARHSLRGRYPDFSIEVTEAYDPEVGAVLLIQGEMNRVFINIIENALYALQEKRRTGGAAYRPALSVCTRRAGERVEVIIRDNGTGIPPAVLQRIFEPFFTTKPPGAGTGLGLSIGHEIVRHHQGELRVTSVPGEFTEFVIALPRARGVDAA